jgi:hypothetical protein
VTQPEDQGTGGSTAGPERGTAATGGPAGATGAGNAESSAIQVPAASDNVAGVPRAPAVSAAARAVVRPMDRLFAAYAMVSGLALAFPGRPTSWPLFVLLHICAILLALRPGPIGAVLAGLRQRAPAAAGALHAWYPLLLVPALYSELAALNVAVHAGLYFDPWILAWEEVLFGGQPSQSWAAAAPHLSISEPLHAAYLSYYLIIYGPPLLLYLRGRSEDFDRVVFTVMLTFFAHYLFFIYLPVQGPRYLFPPPDGPLADGLLFQWTHRLLEGGSSQGAAFPSSHVGVFPHKGQGCVWAWLMLSPC